jgi:hypothetical protein
VAIDLEPFTAQGSRDGVVVDVARTGKLPALIEQLSRTPLFPQGSRFAIVVGTHPHDDHIGGMAEFIDELGNLIDEYWEPGYYHPTTAFFETMRALEDRGIRQLQPTSGTTRFLGSAKVTALSPGIGLRNKFDSYGVDINNASISLMVRLRRRGSRSGIASAGTSSGRARTGSYSGRIRRRSPGARSCWTFPSLSSRTRPAPSFCRWRSDPIP